MMKNIILTAFVMFCSYYCFSQSRKIEVYCEVYDNSIKYENSSRFLPDSLKNVFITIKKMQSRGSLDLVNILSLSGWQVVSTGQKVFYTSTFGIDSEPVYLLKKELEISEVEYKLILERLKTIIK